MQNIHCITCKYYLSDLSCTAFLSRIPDDILFGYNDHSKIIAGQDSPHIYKPKNGKVKNDWTEVERAPAGTSQGGQWIGKKGITEEEISAIKAYTSGDPSQINFRVINRYLDTGEIEFIRTASDGRTTEYAKATQEEIEARIKLIDSYLAKETKVFFDPDFGSDMARVERGVSVYDQKKWDDYVNLKEGDVLYKKAYTSTTIFNSETASGRSVIHRFMSDYPNEKLFDKTLKGNVILEILTKSGKRISHQSLIPDESEILIPRGAKFKVLSREYRDAPYSATNTKIKLLVLKLKEI